MQHSVITDTQLAERLMNGEAQAIALVYERYKNGLFLFCVRLLSDHDAAEDVVQETFEKLIRERSRLKDPAALKTWIFTVGRNASFDRLKKGKNFRSVDAEDAAVFQSESSTQQFENRERVELLEKILNDVLPQYKEVLVLREYESMNYEQIAEVTGTTVSSVKSRLFKARKALMKRLAPLRKESAI